MKRTIVLLLTAFVGVVFMGCTSGASENQSNEPNQAQNEQSQNELQESTETANATANIGELKFEYPSDWNTKQSGETLTITNPDSTCLIVATQEKLSADTPKEPSEVRDLATIGATESKLIESGMTFPNGYKEGIQEYGKARVYYFERNTNDGVQVGYFLVGVSDQNLHTISCTTYSNNFDDLRTQMSDVVNSVEAA